MGRGRGELRTRLAGEQVRVEGRIAPRPPAAPWMEVRHLVGRRRCELGHGRGTGRAAPWRAANRFRRAARRRRVARCHPSAARSSPGWCSATTAISRRRWPTTSGRSGLTHLLAVSGENVAFVLAVAGPLLRRLRPRAALGGHARACWRSSRSSPGASRPSSGPRRWPPSRPPRSSRAGRHPALRHLSLAVCGLVLVDPLLVRSVGFQLSVAASVGILVSRRCSGG